MKRILLSGYYGFNNAGDEAVLFSIINSLRKLDQDLQITVLSNNPEQTANLYNVEAINRWKIKDIFSALQKSDLLISGGGSLLQDVTSKNSILYYLGVIGIAKILRKPVFIYSQGIGPVSIKRNRILTGRILNFTQGITVRDDKSKLDLKNMGINKEITVSADPVLSIHPEDIEIQKGRELLERANVNTTDGKILGVSLRPWQTASKNFTAIAESCDKLAQTGWQIVFIPMHFPDDINAAREVMNQMHEKAYLLIENYTPYETLCLYKATDMVLGMRLHSLIMAAVVEKPLVAISYDPKVDRFMGLLGITELINIDNIDTHKMLDLTKNTWENRRGFIDNLNEKVTVLRQKALQPAQMALELLDK